MQDLYEENYEESEKENFINIVQKRKVLVQKKLTDYFDESDDEFEDNIIEEEEEENDNYSQLYIEEVENQRSMLLHERLNQCFFINKNMSIFKIAKDFLNDYSCRLGYSSNVINDFFDKWIYTDNEELSFCKYAII